MSLYKILINIVQRATITVKAVSAWGAMLFVFAGCGSASQTTQPSGEEPYYVSGLGSFPVSDQIEEAFKSVRRIQNNTIYRSYFFPVGSEIREADLFETDLDARDAQTSVETHSNAGTATVIFNNSTQAVLLTAAHTVNQPDTLIHFADGEKGNQDGLIEAVSIKISENRFVITDYGIVTLDVLNVDDNKDLALLITTSGIEARDQLQVLKMPAGDFGEIVWGSKVFAMGFPRGIQMVSAGVLSPTNHPHRTLLADLNINRGFSGGIVGAINSETGRLEWIGMLTSAMGESLTYLVPEQTMLAEYNPEVLYEGDIFIETHRLIHYGIGYGVAITDINRFVQENESALLSEGIRFGRIN